MSIDSLWDPGVQQDVFRLLLEAEVAGHSHKGEIMITDRKGKKAAILYGKEKRIVNIPEGEEWPNGLLERPGQYKTTPLIGSHSGKVYYYNGFDRVWMYDDADKYRALPRAGFPVMETQDKYLLVYRHARVYRGFRLVGRNFIRDIAQTFIRPMRIAAKLKGGRLVTLTPQGPALLKPVGKGADKTYDLAKRIFTEPNLTLRTYLGRTDEGLAFLAEDVSSRRPRKHVVLWNLE